MMNIWLIYLTEAQYLNFGIKKKSYRSFAKISIRKSKKNKSSCKKPKNAVIFASWIKWQELVFLKNMANIKKKWKISVIAV